MESKPNVLHTADFNITVFPVCFADFHCPPDAPHCHPDTMTCGGKISNAYNKLVLQSYLSFTHKIIISTIETERLFLHNFRLFK